MARIAHDGTSSDRGYDFQWRKLTDTLKRQPAYSFCWLTFYETGEYESNNIQYHHIEKISNRPDLRLDTNNLIPLCARQHSILESKIRNGEPQPDWNLIREKILKLFL